MAPGPQPAHSLTWQMIRAWRVQQHYLRVPATPDALLEVVAQLGGVQAQVMSAAELTLWARIEGLEPDAVQRALWHDRSLVKTWAMRGTLHLLPASELELWQIVPRLDRRYLRPAWLKYFGMSAEDLERLTEAVARALDGQILTREELVDEVSRLLDSRELGEKLDHSWGMMLKPAAFRCLLCFAPSTGTRVRFTRPDRWLGGWRQVDLEHAEREVTRRFLHACGAGTREAYGIWLGVPATRAGALIRSLGEEVTAVDVEGTACWALTERLADIKELGPVQSVRLLPAFDQYVIAASRYTEHFLPGPFKDRIYRPQGWLSPVLLVDGRMDGIWRYERKGNKLLVQIEPFVDLPAHVREAAADEAERLAAYMGRELSLAWI